MMERSFMRTQVILLLYAVSNYSDSEYALLLLIHISPSYELNSISREPLLGKNANDGQSY